MVCGVSHVELWSVLWQQRGHENLLLAVFILPSEDTAPSSMLFLMFDEYATSIVVLLHVERHSGKRGTALRAQRGTVHLKVGDQREADQSP